jgi:hypothetical protein
MATIKWTQDEEAVFKTLGVGPENLSMRKFIRGQRKINGKIFAALNLILDSSPKPAPGRLNVAGTNKMAQARKIIAGIPGPPPGCEPLKGGGGPQT